MHRATLSLILGVSPVWQLIAQAPPGTYPVMPVPLADSAELALAVSAAPPDVSAHATVYAVSKGVVRTLRMGSSGAACIVARDLHAGSLYPICYNAEGANTALKRELLEVRLRSLGVAEDSIARAVTAAYASREIASPRTMAIAYMMSPHQVLFSSPGREGRRVGAWHPHLMLYVPGATPAMFGLTSEDGEPIAFSNPGTPRAEVIVKVPTWADGTPAPAPKRR